MSSHLSVNSRIMALSVALASMTLLGCGSSTPTDTMDSLAAEGGDEQPISNPGADPAPATDESPTEVKDGIVEGAPSEAPEELPGASTESILDNTESTDSGEFGESGSDTYTNEHQTDFLTAGHFTHLYPSLNAEQRTTVRNSLLDEGYTHMYVYIMNQNDYGGPVFDFYSAPSPYVELLFELNSAGLQPVVWLAPDDAPDLIQRYNPGNLLEAWKRVIPMIDSHVSSYVLGLEMDEYWSDDEQQFLGSELNKLTEKTIFIHMTKTKWEPVLQPWADGIIYQYGFGLTPEEITQDTNLMLQRLANYPEKLFIAGEYGFQIPAEESKALGDAAIDAGALGFGNGGSPLPPK